MDVFNLQGRLGIDTSGFSNALNAAKTAAQGFAKFSVSAFSTVTAGLKK